MKKYYTPTIEEFHVGFEYEHLQDDWDGVNIYRGTEYTTFELDVEDELEVIQSNLDDDRLRVKYLDREDIESLGFKIREDISERRSIYEATDNTFLRISVTREDAGSSLSFYHYSGWETPDLHIKNKSELKKLLKMLKIIA